ncbi:hypothetical protein HNQ50_002781 [Silvimonas terrae]|uniref:Uncharacterized protein n=1 Tax=Silvimonas terrae TaxID=300266 RepID=A0A840RHJ2_9NEIS|nr:hypothetical protein [Silvimonas terrae]
MFKTVLIANRGDQPRSGAATKSHCVMRVAHQSKFTAETSHV